MTRILLDINVLIALIDPAHVQHNRAHAWFASKGQRAWATCPLTENGVLRIVGHPRYPNCPGSPAAVAALLAQFRELPGHAFWPDDVSLLDRQQVKRARLLDSAHITDTYLLALARAHHGQLATFDQRLVTDAVVMGRERLHLIR
ncbi:MAG TPA: TA system VapC family ribonuclease toxin [Candidatus Bathyarchaeia archaeon]|nr:TA system VapC family ribonuclease toxin [Candidatus Bathyarchaeia archaeon]